jgi:hypothetical protein
MTLTSKNGQWYYRNWLGLMQSPYFNTKQEAEKWRIKRGI